MESFDENNHIGNIRTFVLFYSNLLLRLLLLDKKGENYMGSNPRASGTKESPVESWLQ
jgi:hypothetical protein